MTDTTVKIRAKGCSNTGITEDLASKLYKKKGSRIIAIVELKVDETHEKADGDRKVDLILTEIEPVVAEGDTGDLAEDQVRRIQRALFLNRQMAGDGQLPFDGDSAEPTVPEVLAAAAAVVETDENGEVTGLWQGDTEAGPGAAGDPFATPGDVDDQGGEDLDEHRGDDEIAPHRYADTVSGDCATCGYPAGAELHTVALEPVSG